VFYPLLGFLGITALLGLYLGGREVVGGHITLGQFVAFTRTWRAQPSPSSRWMVINLPARRASFRRLLDISTLRGSRMPDQPVR
jgi:hypothetical protein